MTTTDMDILAIRQDKISEYSARLRAGESGSTKQDIGPRVSVSNGVAVISLRGFISAKPNWLTQLGFGTSSMQFADAVRAAVENKKIRAVLGDIDSPGGDAKGMIESTTGIHRCRGVKPLIACCFAGTCCSAAYCLASAFDRLFASKSSDTGSIGVVSIHESIEKMLDKEGIEVSVISSSKEKVFGNPYESLTDAARKDLQDRVDAIADEFVARVADNRGISPAAVRKNYGNGLSFRGRKALEAGLIDGIADDMSDVASVLRGTGAFASTVVSDHDAMCEICAAAGYPYVERRSAPLAPAVSRAKKPAAKGSSHNDVLRMMLDLKMKQAEWS